VYCRQDEESPFNHPEFLQLIRINWIAVKVIRSYGLIVWVPPAASVG